MTIEGERENVCVCVCVCVYARTMSSFYSNEHRVQKKCRGQHMTDVESSEVFMEKLMGKLSLEEWVEGYQVKRGHKGEPCGG